MFQNDLENPHVGQGNTSQRRDFWQEITQDLEAGKGDQQAPSQESAVCGATGLTEADFDFLKFSLGQCSQGVFYRHLGES